MRHHCSLGPFEPLSLSLCPQSETFACFSSSLHFTPLCLVLFTLPCLWWFLETYSHCGSPFLLFSTSSLPESAGEEEEQQRMSTTVRTPLPTIPEPVSVHHETLTHSTTNSNDTENRPVEVSDIRMARPSFPSLSSSSSATTPANNANVLTPSVQNSQPTTPSGIPPPSSISSSSAATHRMSERWEWTFILDHSFEWFGMFLQSTGKLFNYDY